MDEGIINVLKPVYRTRLIHRYLEEMENPYSKRSLSVHNAIQNIVEIWEASEAKTIQNYFNYVTFRKNGIDIVLEEEE